jgi:poly(3-hydroxybutyrate) depolymerase
VLYYLYELNHATLAPARAAADMGKLYFSNPINPLTHTTFGKSMAAGFELFERVTRRYGKPEFGITDTVVDGMHVPVLPSATIFPACCRKATNRPQAADRGANVRPLRDPAARHGRDHAADP